MGDPLALTWLYDQVKGRFQAEDTDVPMDFGWQQLAQRGTPAPRILWTPGDDENGAVGEVGAARYPGGIPERSIGTLYELFTITLWGADKDNPENERAQYVACRLLFDAWYRAAFLAAKDTIVVRDTRWVTDMKDRRYGLALRALCTIQAKLPDAPATDLRTKGKVSADIATGYSEAQAETDHFEGDAP